MEMVISLLLIVCFAGFICSFIFDEPAFFAGGLICGVAALFIMAFTNTPPKIKTTENVVTIQEIEYATNKCSPFGGLKEFRSDVIICMDKTEINMNFEPEQKAEAE